MDNASTRRVLIVANKTAATPALIEAVRTRVRRGDVTFHLLVPNPDVGDWRPSGLQHPDFRHGDQVLAMALPLLDEAAGSDVTGSVSIRHDPMDAIEEAVATGDYDEIILSTLPHHVSEWLHLDLPSRVAHLGLPLTSVLARAGERV
jgi:hypothetical protein